MRAGSTMRSLTIALLIFVCGSCGPDDADSSEVFISEEGRFLVEFPNKPKREAASVESGENTLTSVVFTASTDDEAVSVSYVDYPDDITAKPRNDVLAAVAKGSATALQGKVESSTPVTFLGGEALDFRVEAPEGFATARSFMVGNRMYLLQVVRRDNVEGPASFQRLVNTFRFA
ncbi:MAG: hypothetical protein ACT4OM_01255 [Actinomycetota bacterium]